MKQNINLAVKIVVLLGAVVLLLALKFETKDSANVARTELEKDIDKNENDIIKIQGKLDNIYEATQEIKEALK